MPSSLWSCQAGEVLLVGGLVDLAGPHQAHAVAAGGLRAARVPERDPLLIGLGLQRHRRKVVEAAVLGGDLTGAQRPLDDPQHVGEALARLVPVVSEPGVLDRHRASAHAELQAPLGELVQDAHVLDDADGIVHRQQLDHRAEPDLLGDLRRRGDEHLLAGGHAQAAAVVLGEVIAGESGFVGGPDQRQAVLEQLARRRARDVLDVVEDRELGCRHVSSGRRVARRLGLYRGDPETGAGHRADEPYVLRAHLTRLAERPGELLHPSGVGTSHQ